MGGSDPSSTVLDMQSLLTNLREEMAYQIKTLKNTGFKSYIFGSTLQRTVKV
jgi:hypothetical protein